MGFVGWTTYVILVIIKTHTNLTKTVQASNKVGWKHAIYIFSISFQLYMYAESLCVGQMAHWLHVETGNLWSFLATVILRSVTIWSIYLDQYS